MKKFLPFTLLSFFLLSDNQELNAQNRNYIQGEPQTGSVGIVETMHEIAERGYLFGYPPPIIFETELARPDRTNLPQNPESRPASIFPFNERSNTDNNFLYGKSQTIGLNYNAVTGPTETGTFPPDIMGAAGPDQFLVFVNGKIRSFNKSTGTTDGILEVTPNNFFSSVMTPPRPMEITFTSDPNIRYDRMSQRWFLTIIDVIYNTVSGNFSRPNRLLFAVSDGPEITGTSNWTFFQFQADSNLTDYPSLGIDANALYIGTDQFTLTGTFVNTNAYVIRKSSLLGTGQIIYTRFSGLISGGAGPLAPRGIDNPDPGNTGPSAMGYFIGINSSSYGKLILRRILDPGGTPSISENIHITVNTTSNPYTVPHLGNTNGQNGYLDALDERLFAAAIRNGHLWTSHNINVDRSGIAVTGRNRDAVRWYEISDLNTAPVILQSGTVFDNTPSDPKYYFIPSMTVSGQEHAVIGFSSAGSLDHINAGVAGRLKTDTAGVMHAPVLYTSSLTSYNPPGDPGTYGRRRWGDYSFSCVDPDDDMTMWTIQQYCNGNNTYGVQIAQLLAPPPAVPVSCDPPAVAPNVSSINVTINGSCIEGSGFFDPGAPFPDHISAHLGGGIVINSVTYYSPSMIVLNISTNSVPDGFYDVTVINPDGQRRTTAGLIQVDHQLPVELESFTAELNNNSVLLKWRTGTETNNYGFEVERSYGDEINGDLNFKKIAFIPGNGTSSVPHDYGYTDIISGSSDLYYRLKQVDLDGHYDYSKKIKIELNEPAEITLQQNYPNPFNPSTRITYSIPSDQFVRLNVYDFLGREVTTLVNEHKIRGQYSVNFDASGLASGVYICRIRANNSVTSKKMLFLR